MKVRFLPANITTDEIQVAKPKKASELPYLLPALCDCHLLAHKTQQVAKLIAETNGCHLREDMITSYDLFQVNITLYVGGNSSIVLDSIMLDGGEGGCVVDMV